jgi:hypothetical protein
MSLAFDAIEAGGRDRISSTQLRFDPCGRTTGKHDAHTCMHVPAIDLEVRKLCRLTCLCTCVFVR